MRAKLRTVRHLITTVFSAFLVIISPYSAFAALGEQKESEYAQNDITFYNPAECIRKSSGSSGSSDVGGEAVISGSTAEEKVWSGLKSMGLSDEVTAGIMGNMAHEGNYFNPAQHEGSFLNTYKGSFDLSSNSGTSYGIGLIQWSGSRRIRLYNYIKENSPDLIKYLDDPMTYSYANGSAFGVDGDKFIELADNETDVDALYSLELTFLVNEELKANSTYAGVLEQTTVQDAADYFLEKVEVPADIEGTRPIRRNTAEKIYEKYTGKTSFSSSSSSSGVECETGSGSDAGLAEGGMTLAEAEAFMEEYRKLMEANQGKSSFTVTTLSGDTASFSACCKDNNGGVCNAMKNCVSFSWWFLRKYVDHDVPYSIGNGYQVVGNLGAAGYETGAEPRPYAIFSWSNGGYGHTGVVLGVIDENTFIVGESACSANYKDEWAARVGQYSINDYDWTFAYTDEWVQF